MCLGSQLDGSAGLPAPSTGTVDSINVVSDEACGLSEGVACCGLTYARMVP